MDTEKALDLIEAFRDFCAEFEVKFPAYSIGRDKSGIAFVIERPPMDTLERLWRPLYEKLKNADVPVQDRTLTQNGIDFQILYFTFPHPLHDAILSLSLSDSPKLEALLTACENMLWTHRPDFLGAIGLHIRNGEVVDG